MAEMQKRMVACSSCAKKIMAQVAWAGKKLKCPGCGNTFVCNFDNAPKAAPVQKTAAMAMHGGNAFGAVGASNQELNKQDTKRFFIGFGGAIAGGVLGCLIWWIITVGSGSFIFALGFIPAILTGLGMSFGYKKANDFSAAGLSFFLAIGVCCAGPFVFLHDWSKSRPTQLVMADTGMKNALAITLRNKTLEGVQGNDPDYGKKYDQAMQDALAKVKDLSDVEVVNRLNAHYETERRMELQHHIAGSTSMGDRSSPNRPRVVKGDNFNEAGEEVAKMSGDEVTKQVTALDLEDKRLSWIGFEAMRLAAEDGMKVEKLLDYEMKPYREQAEKSAANIKDADMDLSMRNAMLVANNSAQRFDAPALVHNFEVSRLTALLLVGMGLLAGAVAWGNPWG
jgi:predicted RNA-binding Zn-ribbon protein involved in translation (DUF1610 family)